MNKTLSSSTTISFSTKLRKLSFGGIIGGLSVLIKRKAEGKDEMVNRDCVYNAQERWKRTVKT